MRITAETYSGLSGEAVQFHTEGDEFDPRPSNLSQIETQPGHLTLWISQYAEVTPLTKQVLDELKMILKEAGVTEIDDVESGDTLSVDEYISFLQDAYV